MFYTSDAVIVVKDSLRVLKYIGLIFFLPILASVAYGEFSQIPVFAGIGGLTFLASYMLLKVVKTEEKTELRHALVTVALMWMLVSALSAVPFLATGMGFLDALVETMSAWTTTGFTIVRDVEALPHTLLLWRSLMQWIGGIGIVVAVLSGLFRTGGTLFLAEGREEKIEPNIRNTIHSMWKVYLLYTALGIALFALAGMPLFDAVNHTMTAIATGGMSVKNAGVAAYNSPAIEYVFMVLMVLGAISFLTHFNILRGERRKVLRDGQLAAMALLLVAATLAMMPMGPRNSAFQAVSALTDTGFSTVAIPGVAGSFRFILIVLMLIGGSAGSTVGGIKLVRLNILVKSVYWRVRRIVTPDVFFPRTVGGRTLTDRDIRQTAVFVVLFIALFVAGSIVLMGLGTTPADALFESASAIGNAGLSAGVVSPGMHSLGKVTIIVLMWIGRLEIWAVLVLIGGIVIRK